MRVWLLHGIRSDGTGNVDNLEDPLTELGYDVHNQDYRKINLLHYLHGPTYRKRIREAAQYVRNLTKDGDTIITHSNAAVVVWDATRLKRTFKNIICVAPALDRWKFFHPDAAERILLLTNPHDKAIGMTRFLPRWHPGGRMGMNGPEYKEKRMTVESRSNNKGDTHSFWFHGNYWNDGDYLRYTVNLIHDWIQEGE